MNPPKALALALAVALVGGCASSSEERPPSTGSSVGSFLEDAALTTRVKTALTAAGISPTAVHVTTRDGGIVQLSGFVGSPDEARRAADIARRVEGVKYVYDDIRIAPRG